MGRAIKNSKDSSILIEPLAERNLEEVAELYFRIGPFLKFSSARIVEEYLRRNIESKSYLRGYVIKKNGKLVGSSLIVRWDEKVGALLFTVTDESFAGFERLLWLGRAYRETIKALVAEGIAKVRSSTPTKNPTAIKYTLATGYIKYAEVAGRIEK